MQGPITTRAHALLLMLSLGLSGWAIGQDPETEEEARRQIKVINAELSTLESRIREQTSEREVLLAKLREVDLSINRLSNNLRQVERAISKQQRQLNDLQGEADKLERKADDLQEAIETQIGAFSVLRQGGDLKILFGDSRPQDAARHLAYFSILVDDQIQQIESFESTLAALEENRQQTEETRQTLVKQQKQLASDQIALKRQRDEQRDTVAAVNASLERDGQRVATLRADNDRLSELLKALALRLKDLDLRAGYAAFESLKGKLPRPISETPSTRFGHSKNRGDLAWQGWLIPADMGKEVRAIHYGRIVYSDWLRGQGLLTIIDHGDGWMSLYGHNDSLTKEPGDWVQPGEVIARVGSSGGVDQSALYFEIRFEGSPVDPAPWMDNAG
ncbi:MAG: peptidoglycan DD-metalloendopeptidase family protein [Luminiphilus sp.]|nr:peptidoglycan DD-metalloendopeptidase family protein [Luminiphilus sp.]